MRVILTRQYHPCIWMTLGSVYETLYLRTRYGFFIFSTSALLHSLYITFRFDNVFLLFRITWNYFSFSKPLFSFLYDVWLYIIPLFFFKCCLLPDVCSTITAIRIVEFRFRSLRIFLGISQRILKVAIFRWLLHPMPLIEKWFIGLLGAIP